MPRAAGRVTRSGRGRGVLEQQARPADQLRGRPFMQRTFVNVVLGVLLAIMIGWILVIGRPVILPIAAGLIVAYIVLGLAEFVGSVPRVGASIPTPLRFALSLLIILGVLSTLVLALISNIGTIIASAPRYEAQLLSMIQMGAERIGIETEPSWQTLRDDALARIDLQRTIGATLASVTAIVGTFVIVMIYAGFLVAERRAFAQKIDRISDDPQQVRRIREIIADVNSRIGTYLLMKTLVNVVLGLVSYAIMRLAGIEFAGFWALMIGLFNYVPYVGSFLGVFFPVLLSAMQFGAIGPVVTITIALTATQMAIGNFVEPYLMGNSLNLSPFVIIVSLVVWSSIWGVAGAILSVPIMAILVIILSEFDGTRPLAVLMSLDGRVAPSHLRED